MSVRFFAQNCTKNRHPELDSGSIKHSCMIKTFVKTQNVRNFIGLIENLQNKPKNIPKMALVYGEPGLGKSQNHKN